MRITESEHFLVKKKAQEAGLGLSAFCRRATLKKQINPKADSELVRQLSQIGNNINQIAKIYNSNEANRGTEAVLIGVVKMLQDTLEKVSNGYR